MIFVTSIWGMGMIMMMIMAMRERMGVGINLILEFALSFVLLAVQGLHSAQYIKLNMNIRR